MLVHEKRLEFALEALDRRRNELDTVVRGATLYRAEHGEAMRALSLVIGRDTDPQDAEIEARTALRHLADLDVSATRLEALTEELRAARTRQQRQRTALAAAAALSRQGEDLASLRDVAEALEVADLETRSLEERARGHDSAVAEGLRQQELLESRRKSLLAHAARWRELDSVAQRLEGMLGSGLRTADELEAARQVLDGERDELQRRLEASEDERARILDRARLLEQSGGIFHDDLLAARDLVGGELLASAFEDLQPGEAGLMQARLGPLTDAIVVEDARRAAAALDGHDRELDTLWFVEGGSLHGILQSNGDGENGSDLTVEQHGIVRRTRIPKMPTLGRRARQRLIAELRDQSEELGTSIAELGGALAELAARRRDTALLTSELNTLVQGDPTAVLLSLEADLEQLSARVESETAAAEEARGHTREAAQRVGRLRDLLADAFLLDEPDLTNTIAELQDALRSAEDARNELRRVTAARRTLEERVQVLRQPPLSEDELEQKRQELAQLHERREQLFCGLDALHYVTQNRGALAWTDAEDALGASQDLVPALKAQCDRAEREQEAAVQAAEEAYRAWEDARAAWREIDDRRGAVSASRAQATRELEETLIDDSSEAAVLRAREEVRESEALVASLDRIERKLADAIARLEERLASRNEALTRAEEHLSREERESKPAQELWERLRARSESRGLLTPTITRRLLEDGSSVGSVNLRSEARTNKRILEERLSTARGGREILEQIQSRFSSQDLTTGDDDIEVWELVRDWLSRRVPAQIAEVDDPIEALERLRHHLCALSNRLENQEAELRGASEDVARGIEVHIRSAYRQARLLNTELTGVHFGTIQAIRIGLSRDTAMERVLNALREGSAQELLFAPTMPVEEALDALFARYGGGGATLGQKLLDYREYLTVAVEIQRRTSTEWERVNPSRLSTGEAIGVGTALMMVVLTAWERTASLFRAKRSLRTLRLLFLDEANRLSQDNLEVLFQLCNTLHLQLLIAAPEVARAPGCTTYRLVRRATADGGEEVVVSGRRTIRVAAAEHNPPPRPYPEEHSV